MNPVKCPACRRTGEPIVVEFSTRCPYCNYEYELGRDRLHVRMGLGGPTPHQEWDCDQYSPSKCPYYSTVTMVTEIYPMCWHPKVCRPAEDLSVKLDDVLCSPEHCPLL